MGRHTDAAKLRIARALEHVEEFEKGAGEYLEAHQDLVKAERGEDSLPDTHRLAEVGEVPDSLKQAFGDAVNNLAEACDNLVRAFAKDVRPTWRVAMPVTNDPSGDKGFDAWALQHKKLPKTVIEALRSVQPFNAYEVGGHKLTGASHPLRLLKDLWDFNKHEDFLEAVPAHKSIALEGFKIERMPPDLNKWIEEAIAKGPMMTLTFGGEAKSDAVVATTRAGEDYRVRLGIDLALKQGVPGEGRFASELLRCLHGFVLNQVVGRLESA